jgi:parallel beta-helix repeat protein
MMGLGAWQATGLMVTDNRFAFNNHEGFARSGRVSEAAGAKLTATRNLTVTDNLFEGNFATGLWLDINVTNAIITRNIFRDNLRHGAFYEISSNGIIASNIFKGNGVSGIALANAAHMQVYNNTLVANAISFLVQDDSRVNDDPKEIKLGNSWISGDTVFYNNLVCGNGGSQGVYIWARDFSGALDAGEMITASDFNGYCRRGASGPRRMVEWWRNASRSFYANLNEYRSATARDLNSVMFDDTPANPFFAGAPSGNFILKPGSAARNAGRDLPRDVADAIGVASRRKPDLGALLLPGGDVVTPEEYGDGEPGR